MTPCVENMMTALREVKRCNQPVTQAGEAFFRYLERLGDLEAGRGRYGADATSRAVFDWVMQYRIVRSFLPKKTDFSLANTPYSAAQWNELAARARQCEKGFKESDYLLDIIDTWLLESYTLRGECEVAPGDIVLDCGTYTGNTSWYFSEKTGPSGHVYGFEGAGATYAVYQKHMQPFANVTPVHAAVCDRNGEVTFMGNTPGAHIGQQGESVPAVTLDVFCRERAIPRVDFIKMDIEGAEAEALCGAAHIVQAYKPKMALSAYHKLFDIVDLPAAVLAICPDYRFALRHFSNEVFETVLFCIPAASPAVALKDEALHNPLPGQVKALLFSLLADIMKEQNLMDVSSHLVMQTEVMAQKLEAAAQSIKELSGDNYRLAQENAALKKVLARLGGTL